MAIPRLKEYEYIGEKTVKPRIVIADKDYDFIIPLQVKFAETFFNEIEIEIITDEALFTARFSGTKKASEIPDILLAQEEMCTGSILKYEIGHICILTNNKEKVLNSPDGIEYLYRFSSVKEIFNKIKGYLPIGEQFRGSQIIVVCSAKGGVGKTTLALGICSSLTNEYKRRVFYINAAYLQSFQRLLINKTSISPKESAKLSNSGEKAYEVIKPSIRQEDFFYLPPFRAALSALGLDYSIYADLIFSAKKSGNFDYIVVDIDSAIDSWSMELIKKADKILVVTDQTEGAIFATNLLGASLAGTETDKFLFVCNNFRKDYAGSVTSPKFDIKELVEHIPQYDMMDAKDFSKIEGIQKIAVLLA